MEADGAELQKAGLANAQQNAKIGRTLPAIGRGKVCPASGPVDVVVEFITLRMISVDADPRPAGENAALRDDAVREMQ